VEYSYSYDDPTDLSMLHPFSCTFVSDTVVYTYLSDKIVYIILMILLQGFPQLSDRPNACAGGV
jgi:hypothetical protein